MLEGGDGTFGVGEGGLEVSDDLRRRRAWAHGGQLGWQAPCEECGANVTLCKLETSYDAL